MGTALNHQLAHGAFTAGPAVCVRGMAAECSASDQCSPIVVRQRCAGPRASSTVAWRYSICVRTRYHRGEHGGGQAGNGRDGLRRNPGPPGRARRGPGTEFLSLPSPPARWGRRVGDEGLPSADSFAEAQAPALSSVHLDSASGCIPQLSPRCTGKASGTREWHATVAATPRFINSEPWWRRLQAGQSEQPIATAYGLPPPASRLRPHTNSRTISGAGGG